MQIQTVCQKQKVGSCLLSIKTSSSDEVITVKTINSSFQSDSFSREYFILKEKSTLLDVTAYHVTGNDKKEINDNSFILEDQTPGKVNQDFSLILKIDKQSYYKGDLELNVEVLNNFTMDSNLTGSPNASVIGLYISKLNEEGEITINSLALSGWPKKYVVLKFTTKLIQNLSSIDTILNPFLPGKYFYENKFFI